MPSPPPHPLRVVCLPQARASLLRLLMLPSLHATVSHHDQHQQQQQQPRHNSSNNNSNKYRPPHASPSSSPLSPQKFRWRHRPFPYLSILLYVDAGATLDILSIAMDSPEAIFTEDEENYRQGRQDIGNQLHQAEERGDSRFPSPPSSPANFQRDLVITSSDGVGGRTGRVGGRAKGGGVWGMRLGRGRSRATGWTANAQGKSGREREGGVGGKDVTWGGGRDGQALGGEGVVCPSRRNIVEVRRLWVHFFYCVCLVCVGKRAKSRRAGVLFMRRGGGGLFDCHRYRHSVYAEHDTPRSLRADAVDAGLGSAGCPVASTYDEVLPLLCSAAQFFSTLDRSFRKTFR